MGQKVNPISMRLQVNKNWRSKWFSSKKDFAKNLAQDLAVRRYIDNKFKNRGAVNSVDIANCTDIGIWIQDSSNTHVNSGTVSNNAGGCWSITGDGSGNSVNVTCN